ncbi:MAG: glycosyltransferase family 2 protein [Candidatus Atribacteria bacterium]|nr:glycosyltransferase family 2 protein [Candidatus Atribacteria bacterium]
MESSKIQTSENETQNHPLVSIITPTYNHEKFIGTCIESVLKQSYPNWEMIIIDDGSSDRTGSIVAAYDDERIKYIKQDNVGIWKLKKTYNKALHMSKGELVAILEGDDAWPSYKLEEQVKIFKKKDVIFSWGRKNTINDQNHIISFDLPSLNRFRNMPPEEMTKILIIANFIQPCTVMINKDALLSIGGFVQHKETPYVDYPTFLELSLKGRFYPSDRVMGYWRKHKAQITTQKETDMNRGFMVSIDFYENLSPAQKKSINFKVEDKLEFREKILNDQIAVSARLALVKGDWKEASTCYRSIFKQGDLKIKIQSLLGVICAFLRIDLEWFAVLTCKPKIRDASGEWDTTLFKDGKKYSNWFKVQLLFLKLLRRIRPFKYADSQYLLESDFSQ